MSRRTGIVLIIFATVLGLAAWAGAHSASSVHAQGGDNDYVDVAVILEVAEEVTSTTSQRINIIVVNQGSRTAYDVEVTVDVVEPDKSYYFQFETTYPVVPVGSASLENNARSFRWSIPALGGLQRAEISQVRVTHVHTTDPTLAFDNRSIPHEYFGEVTTSSFESHLHQGNNTSRIWSYRYSASRYYYRQAAGNYTVAVSVDEPNPSPGGAVNFTIAADITTPADYDGVDVPPIDMKVDIGLTGGLSVSGTPTYASGALGTSTVPASVSYSNGVFTIGTLTADDVTRHSVTLPVTVSSDAVVNEQCLTATVTGNPPPDTGPLDDDISDNVAKLCLGDQPAEPFASGQVDLFNIYPCVGNTNPPCDSTDDVRVRAVRNTDETVLRSGKALVHILDEENRIYDSHSNSVNAGTIVSWQIPVTWNAAEFNAVNTQWSNARDGFTASGTNGGAPPGRVHIRAFEGETYAVIYKMTPDTTPQWTFEDIVGFNPGTSNGPFEYIAEFEKLGTYKLQFTAKLTRATLDGDEDCDPNTANPPVNQRFCASETYTLHVGPMADLTVEDGGSSTHAGADQHALTIVAVNNGPDEPSIGARVTGLPTGAEVLHISQGTYDDSTGEWDIGELKLRSRYQSAGEPDPTLVLSASASDTATVSIANSENYEVCVGPMSNPGNLAHTTQAACEAVTDASWNSTPVYDYNDGNNTATITAQAGTGGVGEGIPTLQTPTVHSPSVASPGPRLSSSTACR